MESSNEFYGVHPCDEDWNFLDWMRHLRQTLPILSNEWPKDFHGTDQSCKIILQFVTLQ